ncbi:MAG: twin-arginine translocase TatA/TatE family subunit [Homoserinimonas sp.]
MPANLGGWTGIILLVIILLLFGANKLPALARGMGQSLRIFKSEVKTPPADEDATERPRDEEPRQANATRDDVQEPQPKPKL